MHDAQQQQQHSAKVGVSAFHGDNQPFSQNCIVFTSAPGKTLNFTTMTASQQC
jgi:hypothetical protein